MAWQMSSSSASSPLLHVTFVVAVLVLLFPTPSSASGSGEWRDGRQSELLQLGAPAPEAETARPLRFSAGSTFKVALFADLHYGENAWTTWGPAQDGNSDRVMAGVLDRESPDFVIYLGDVITANNLPMANASLAWDRAISPTRSRGIPWATVFGNHDDARFEWPPEWFSAAGVPPRVCPMVNSSCSTENLSEGDCRFKGTSRLDLMAKEIEGNALSLSSSGPIELWPSVSNYVLNVFSSKDKDSVIVLLYFLDSGGGSYPEVISNAQAQWFQQKSQEINPDSTIPEIIFWHIPSRAYKRVAPSRKFGIQMPCVGSINMERISPQEAEWGMMDILLDRPSVKAVFSGHNHGLDWCCPYKKLWLCFARHTGYGGYGDWPRGARMLEMSEQPFAIRSWIGMEDGSQHSHVNFTCVSRCKAEPNGT